MKNTDKVYDAAKDKISKCMYTTIIQFLFKKETKILTTYKEQVQLKENAP